MKQKLFLLMTTIFCETFLFAQIKTVKPLAQKKVVTTTATKPLTNPNQVKTQTPPPPPTDLQKAVVNIIVGDDGKDDDTRLAISINDGHKRLAAYYGDKVNTMGANGVPGDGVNGIKGGEYFPGDNETLPITMYASVPTGETKLVGALPLPVLREAALSDFTNNNGGSIQLVFIPNGHDTWKINSFSVTLYFNNDPGTPHKITWTGITLSQDSRTKDLEFDKNFNPIQ